MASQKKKKSTTKRARPTQQESDSVYVLKIVMYLVLGSQWLRIESLPEWSIPIPLGLVIGLLFVSHDHFAIDRKIEYAVLFVSAFVAFWLPMGVLVSV